MGMKWSSWVSVFLDTMYPPSCIHCGARGFWWCETCREKVERLDCDPCPQCLKMHGVGLCNDTLPFEGVVACGYYHSPPLRRMIAAVKYQGVTALACDVEVFLSRERMARSAIFPWSHEPSLHLLPMPLASSRERERGFNQAVWLAERMRAAWHFSGPLLHQDILTRSLLISPQAEIDDPNIRAANVSGSFMVHGTVPEAILLIDDVVTTGSTAKEAALCLKKAGAKRVYVTCLALGR